MLKNFIKIFLRNFRRHVAYSVSNVIGLAVGMVTCVLILLFVRYEFNWNTYHEKYDRIYRVQQQVDMKGDFDIYTQTGYALAGELENKIPEVEQALVVREIWGEYLSSSDELSFNEPRGYYAHNDVFHVFTFHFLQGNASDALAEPFSVVLTEEIANKYFPQQDPMGKIVKASKNQLLKVTGIIANLPPNLDFRPDYLVSFKTYPEVTTWKEYADLKNIGAGAFRTYVLLKPNTTAQSVNAKIYNLVDDYVPDSFKKLYLKPLSEIHLTSNERNDIKIALYYLGGIAIFVLILASINFINLATANANLRLKEIGVRKVVGASKMSLFKQFIAESLSYSLLAMILAFVLAELLLPSFSTVVQRQLTIDYTNDRDFLLFMTAAFLVTGLLSGIYPALYLSAFQPVDVIKGNLFSFLKGRKDYSKSLLRKSLVAFQFFISITLIIATVYVMKQVSFMKNKDLGFEKENLILCRVFGTNADGRFETLRNELLRDPDVVNATISTNAPFNGSWGREINWEGAAVDEKINIRYNPVGYSFIPTYEMKMKLGRNFSEEHSTDSEACIINETAWRAFGWDDPLGKRLDDNRFTVIGVVEDFHPYSVHEKIPAYYMTLHSGELKDGGIYTVSIEPRNRDAGVEFIDRQFRTFFPDAIVEVTNFDKELDLGTKDVWEIVEKVFFAFSIIAILIAANGLFGLVSFAAQRRLKEIGVRRVFGADSAGLYWMMSKEFLVLLLFAIALAAPAGYLVAQSTPGAYKYNLQFIDYFFSIGLMFLTALAATIYHTTRAVLSNPVETLRCE